LSALADAVQRVVTDLSDAHITALCVAYGGAEDYSPEAASTGLEAVPVLHRSEVERLNRGWAEQPQLPGAALALALESARGAARRSAAPQVEVVVTGPDSPDAPVRLTSEVVRQLIDRAEHRVTMVSYAAYQLPAVVAALDAAVARGVQVNLILESPEKLEGGGGAHAYARFRTYQWPVEHRDPPDAKLHAKAVIVDSRDVLLTSANMTGAAYDKNIELGVLCRGGDVAAQVQRHFDALIRAGTLTTKQ
jgi:phosphatidylserine/phosphatidylglycerophosphate/cardiolipin synthase-like enzyme